MQNAIQELFKDGAAVRAEILNIREAIGNVNATDKTFDAAIKSLLMMRIYCPAECQTLVDSQIAETERRNYYRLLSYLKKI